MDYQTAINKINSYLESSANSPIIVDVPNTNILNKIRSMYKVGANEFIEASSYCKDDSLVQLEKLQDRILSVKKKHFLTELSSFLKLEGEAQMKRNLFSFLDLSPAGKLVIITFQSEQYLHFSDPRPASAGRVIIIDAEEKGQSPVLYFVNNELADTFEVTVPGINRFAKFVEESEMPEIYITTKWQKKQFPDSLFDIKSYSSVYEVLKESVTELNGIDKEYGDEKQWAYLRSQIEKYETWSTFVLKEFGGVDNLPQNLSNFPHFTDEKKWSYFIALNVCGARNTEYLAGVVNHSNSIDSFFEFIYSDILSYAPNAKNFQTLYQERRDILDKIEFPISTVTDFCKHVQGKGEDAIYYLTDRTQQEKELIIELICKYPNKFTHKGLCTLLAVVYPDLGVYLSNFNYGNDLLTKYFNSYKFCKVTNKIATEHMEMVQDQAVKRDYNTILSPRTYILSKMDINSSKLYFVDAMGVEFMSYLQDRLYKKNLDYKVEYARCDLPSITSKNKDFVDVFKNAGCQKVDIKKLDELKHEGTSKYNYEYTKLPIHIIEEFVIIDKFISNIEQDLHVGDVKKVFLISDHGASRLAVINEVENKWEISEKGEHSGRCCPVSEISDKPEFATEENGYWSLANYDRFKGGKKASVEVHGGASLEEVVVPIIEITKAGDKPKCHIDEAYKVVTASFKVDATIRIFISKDIKNVRVCLNGQFFEARPSEQKYYYDVVLNKIRKGHYSIDVYDETTIIATGLEFDIKSAGAIENKYF